MDKVCKFEYLNLADMSKMWCIRKGCLCMNRSNCSDLEDGYGMEQEEHFILKCEKCGWAGHPNLHESGPHAKAICGNPDCGAYIKMLSKKDLNTLLADTSVIKREIYPVEAEALGAESKGHKTKLKYFTMSRSDAFDTYIEIREGIKDLPYSDDVYTEAICNLLSRLVDSHSQALSRIEEMEAEKNDPLFGEKATQQRIDQMAINFTYMSSRMDALHSILCPHLNGTWQERANQVVKEVQAIKRLLEGGDHE